jgi:hypothetical protein
LGGPAVAGGSLAEEGILATGGNLAKEGSLAEGGSLVEEGSLAEVDNLAEEGSLAISPSTLSLKDYIIANRNPHPNVIIIDHRHIL